MSFVKDDSAECAGLEEGGDESKGGEGKEWQPDKMAELTP